MQCMWDKMFNIFILKSFFRKIRYVMYVRQKYLIFFYFRKYVMYARENI